MIMATEYLDRARTHLSETSDIQRRFVDRGLDPLAQAADLIVTAFSIGGKLLLCGNGGSAADCQHMAAEFVSRLTKEFERPGLPAIALTTDTSFLTAYANDSGFEGIFERQVRALGRPGDVLIGISSSGNSSNVIRATCAARELKIKTIGLSGEGGALQTHTDCAIVVPSHNTQYIQETLLVVEHILCDMTEQIMFGR